MYPFWSFPSGQPIFFTFFVFSGCTVLVSLIALVLSSGLVFPDASDCTSGIEVVMEMTFSAGETVFVRLVFLPSFWKIDSHNSI